MKTIEEKAREFGKAVADGTGDFALGNVAMDAFIAGYNEAQRWISVEEELPEEKKGFVLCKNKNGLHPVSTEVKSNICYIKEMYDYWQPID